MTSILQAQIEVVVLAANNSQFSGHPRGRTGQWEESGGKKKKNNKERELVFSSCLENNNTPGESIATRRACLFTVKMICRALSLPLMLYKR